VKNLEPASFNPAIDGPQTQTACNQLLTGQHAVLPPSEGRKLSFPPGQRLARSLLSTCR
jgi:hypothetical protein